MKKILLPTDFSDNAWNAIVYALKLYKNEPCKFYFLNSIALKSKIKRTYMSTNYRNELKNKATKQLLDLKDKATCVKTNPNHFFEVIISTSKLTKAIKKSVKKYNINMVVLATKGTCKTSTMFFGNKTTFILKKMNLCPILVVPNKYNFEEPKQIAFPTDYNHFYKIKELKALSDLSQLFNSKIRVMHIASIGKINHEEHCYTNNLDNCLEEFEHSFHWVPNYSQKTKILNNFIKELNISILTIVNYRHSIIESIIKEHVIKKIGFNPIIPFLVIPE